MPARLLALIVCVASLALGQAARADEPVLAVLYVDNHSGDADYDVLKKGLADMLVTDLAAQGLTVVERTRLQALIDEQALQATSFVDPDTAVRVGKGLGATHVVSGSLVAVKPKIRLDLRMVDVATGKVVVTAAVTGLATALFDLEQQLVGKFVGALDRTLRAVPLPTTKVKDAQSLLEYSRGLDLADRGELDAAKKQLDAAVRRSPVFGLARLRRDALLTRLAASNDKRDARLAEDRADLMGRADRGAAARPSDEAGELLRLTWVGVRGRLMASAFDALMSQTPFGVARMGQERALRGAMTAWVDNASDFVKSLDGFVRAHPKGWLHYALVDEDERLAKGLGVDLSFASEPGVARLEMARFILLGELHRGTLDSLTIAPPLASLDPAWETKGLALLDEAIAAAHAAVTAEPRSVYRIEQAIDCKADFLLLRGRTEDAVQALQEVLDRYPTGAGYTRIERRIKQVLGLEHDSTTSDLASWERGLAGCLDMPLRVGIDAVAYRSMRMRGLDALPDIARAVEAACTGKASAKQFWEYLYAHLGRAYGKHGRCAEFEQWMQRSVAAGGSPSDVAGWRKNWTACPMP